MRAYHFLKADWTTQYGHEPAWKIGEERSVEGPVTLGTHGYHSSPTWFTALDHAWGPVACVVDVSEPIAVSYHLQVSETRRLVAGANCSRELRLFAIEACERGLAHDRRRGYEPEPVVFAALEVARRMIEGNVDEAERREAEKAACLATWPRPREHGAHAVTWALNLDVVWAARHGAQSALPIDEAYEAELAWEARRLAELLDARVGAGP